MIRIRRANERGHARHGWLESFHSFSFADYHDPRHMGFRQLRVLNDDRVQPGRGFGRHAHRDMEIVTYVVEGALEHRDSLGNGSVIRPGDVQRMSAGTRVVHSEYNPSDTDVARFLQVWILPERDGLAPSYEQKRLPVAERRGGLRVVVSPDGRQGSVRIHQDAILHAGLLEPGEPVTHPIAPGRHAWVQLVRGAADLGEIALGDGDGAAVSGEAAITLVPRETAEVLVFDLA